MKIYLVAVGSKAPEWVVQGFNQYAQRLPKHYCLELIEVPAANHKHGNINRVRQEEARRILKRIPAGSRVIALSEGGKLVATRTLSEKLDRWLQAAVDVAILIGGADGLDPSCMQRADECWSLSRLTFPHALVRVIVAEQIYRAWTISSNHPYHRDYPKR